MLHPRRFLRALAGPRPVPPAPEPCPPGRRADWRDRVVGLLDAAGIDFWEVPLSWSEPFRVGVRAGDLPRFAAALQRDYPQAMVSCPAAVTGSGRPLPAAQVDLSAAFLVVHGVDGPLPAEHWAAVGAVQVEPWFPAGGDAVRSVLPNPFAQVLDLARATPASVLSKGVRLRTFADFSDRVPLWVDFPVDGVCLWVDGADRSWQAKRAATIGKARLPESSMDARFRDHGELRFMLRSVAMFAPWLRTMFLLTDAQVPSWLAAEHPGLVVVDHRDVLDSACLPTFNSHALSAVLHRVPGLSERFLYWNDDVFLGRPVDPSLWWTHDGSARIHFSGVSGPGPSVAEAIGPVLARRNTSRLLRDAGLWVPRGNLQHGPQPLSREVMADAWERWPEELAATSSSPFRDPDDVEPVWLCNGLALATGRAVVGPEASYRYVQMGSPEAAPRLERLLRSRSKDVFCLNDAVSAGDAAAGDVAYAAFLSTYFPHPGPFER